jgi:AAA15 family ATPase/GTPase
VVFSMLASNAMKDRDEVRENAPIPVSEAFRVLPVAVVYGANAHGKSNLIKAFRVFQWFSMNSFQTAINQPIPTEPFRLSTLTEHAPSEFELTFYNDGFIYRYGFIIDSEKIHKEWLIQKKDMPKSREIELFLRDSNHLSYHKTIFRIGRLISHNELFKDESLVLFVAASLNDSLARSLIQYISRVNVLSGLQDSRYEAFSKIQLKQKTPLFKRMFDLIAAADMDIKGMEYKPDTHEVITLHSKYDENNNISGDVNFMLTKNESHGTRKFFNLSGPILTTLEEGGTLIIDELDSKLHPNLLERIVKLFQNTHINRNRAQLIFASHNTALLGSGILRRDQVWFAEKDNFGVTRLLPLLDYKQGSYSVRQNAAIEKQYTEGRFGGVPFLGDLDNLLEEKQVTYGQEE